MEERKLRKEAGIIQSMILIALANKDSTLDEVTDYLKDHYGKKYRGKTEPPRAKEIIFHHLKELVKIGLIESAKEEREIQYKLNGPNEDKVVKRKIDAIVYRMPDSYLLAVPAVFLFVWKHNRSLVKDLMATEWYQEGCSLFIDAFYDVLKISGQFDRQPEISEIARIVRSSEWAQYAEKFLSSMDRDGKQHESIHRNYKPSSIKELRKQIRKEIEAESAFLKKSGFINVDDYVNSELKFLEENYPRNNIEKKEEEHRRLINNPTYRALSFITWEIKEGKDNLFYRFLLFYLLSYDRGKYNNVMKNLVTSFPDSAHFFLQVLSDSSFIEKFTEGEKPTPSAAEFMSWLYLQETGKKVEIPEGKYATVDEWRDLKVHQFEILYSYFLDKGYYEGIPSPFRDKRFFQTVFLYKVAGTADVNNVIIRERSFYSFLFMWEHEFQYLDVIIKGLRENIGMELELRNRIFMNENK